MYVLNSLSEAKKHVKMVGQSRYTIYLPYLLRNFPGINNLSTEIDLSINLSSQPSFHLKANTQFTRARKCSCILANGSQATDIRDLMLQKVLIPVQVL